jgi:hypothetical protein
MPRKQKKYHFIYKTTNLINEKYYVGMHSTDDLNDGYIGSGKYLSRSIKKYGINNFKFEILEFLPNRALLKEREKKIVNENFINNNLCMNLKTGGSGGNLGKNGERLGGDNFKKACEYWKIPENKKKLIDRNREIGKKRFENGELKNFKCDWTGRKHKLETKLKIGKSNSMKQKGEKNSQYGSCWITNGFENKKIKRGNNIPDGWKLGRILK